ncbi:hypothetical protein LWI28_006504 [Acer negundo]|uniref:Uncharacterized protein n=1 Tax=Acer negundo TaxID=4023 RepID=A0AAD5IDD2_ACENE|nr:hypothetical protein LWI28_006504 [Acer negundo]
MLKFFQISSECTAPAEVSPRKLVRTRGLKQKTTLAGRGTVGFMPGIFISEAQAAQRAKEEEAKKKSEDAAARSSRGKGESLGMNHQALHASL